MASTTDAVGIRLLSFGEAMLRFTPVDERQDAYRGKPSALTTFDRSVGGDELNVCVALARLGRDAAWASVLPPGPLGEVVRSSAKDAGVRMDYVVTHGGEEAEVGTYHVVPESTCVHYQRRHSAFCTQPAGLFNWEAALAERGEGAWLHLTGITPMLGEQPAACWSAALDAAKGIPTSLDLNYRPQLGSFDKLWGLVGSRLQSIDLLIMSAHSTQALVDHLGVEVAGAAPAKRPRLEAGVAVDAELARTLAASLEALHAKLAGPALACCMKTRGADGRQSRWSLIVDADGVHSTEATPTTHRPKDEFGGGSAWAAGAIDALSAEMRKAGHRRPERRGAAVVFGKAVATKSARRGDILAALAQESHGDHSTATQSDLDAVEVGFPGAAAVIDGLSVRFSGGAVVTSAATSRPLNGAAAHERVMAALKRMDAAKVIAILRAKYEKRCVDRAVELAELGFRAIEVTADSAGFAEGTLLPAVCAAVGDRALIGVGTVVTMAQLETAARGGAHFALSPVRPTAGGWGSEGFVRACHRMGILAMPAAFSPQEIYECVEEHGAHTVKIFPAQLWSPKSLQDLRRVGIFGKYRLCPSGGIDCFTAEAWLAAGAFAVGMGGCLVGKDVGLDPSDRTALNAAEVDWICKTRPDAAALATQLRLAPAV